MIAPASVLGRLTYIGSLASRSLFCAFVFVIDLFERLFDGRSSNPSICPWKDNMTGAAFHLKKVAGQIRATDVDILGVQEVQDCAMLARLVALLPGYKGYLLPGRDTATEQNVAIVTRIDPVSALFRTNTRVPIPLPDAKCSATIPPANTGVSKNLVLHFQTSAFDLDLIVVHFKSNSAPKSCQQRAGQAAIISSLVDPYRTTVVLGDFNCQESEFQDASGNVGTEITLQLLRNKGLINVGEELSQSRRRSLGNKLIDHILVSKNLFESFRSVDILLDGYPYSSKARTDAGYSDHVPYILTLNDADSVPLPSDENYLLLIVALGGAAILCSLLLIGYVYSKPTESGQSNGALLEEDELAVELEVIENEGVELDEIGST